MRFCGEPARKARTLATLVATAGLAMRMAERREELMEEAEGGMLRVPRIRSFRIAMPGMTHRPMPRQDEDQRDYHRPRSRSRYAK